MQIWLNDLLPSVQSLGLWGYWLVGLLAFGEGFVLTSVFAPGTVVVVLGGALAAQGIYDFGDMVWFVAIGTILGAEASFRVGHRSQSLFQEQRRIFSMARLRRGERFFARFGSVSIVFGHFFGPLRPIVPVVAGLAGMAGKRFLLWNVIGGVGYAVAMLGVGFFFGTAANLLGATITRAGLFIIAVLLMLAALWVIAAKLRRTRPFLASVLRSVGGAIRGNPDVRALVARHPRVTRFAARRVARDAFSGLPTTILASVLVYFLFLYAGSTLDFVTQSQIVQADLRLASLLASFRDPALVHFFTLITAFGSWKTVAVLLAAASALIWLRSRPYYLWGLWLAVIGNEVTVGLLKHLFARPRPEWAVYTEASFSFPSGHSATSVAFYGSLTFILIRERFGAPLATFLAGCGLVFLIGLSRLYLVEHYLSDVVNGYLVGALWALAGIWVSEALRIRGAGVSPQRGAGASPPIPLRHWRNVASVAVAIGALLGTGFLVATYQNTRSQPPLAAITKLDTSLEAAFSEGLLPTYSENILGAARQPVSVIVLARDDTRLLAAFDAAGWKRADTPDIKTMSRAAFAVWFGADYPTAPITPAFWNGHPHDFGFEAEATSDTLRQRHHARFWRTGFRSIDGRMIYVGTASFDDGLKWGLTHHIDPDIDAERNLLVANLAATGQMQSSVRVQLVPPALGKNLTGDPFFTDGKSAIVRIGAGTGADLAPAASGDVPQTR